MKITPRDRALLGVIAVLLACAAFYELVLTPERHAAARLQAQVTAAHARLARAQQRELQGHAAEVALRASQSDWEATQRAVPQVSNVPALLKLLQRSAQAARVSMQSISFNGAGTSSAAGASPAVTAATPSTRGGTNTLPVTLVFDGGYQALNRLVHRLDALVNVSRRHIAASGPLIGIGAVTLSPAGNSSDHSALSVQLTATIYQRAAASAVVGSTG